MRPDTIYALSSGRGVAGVAVIRLSGPDSRGAIEAMTAKPAPAARRAVLRSLIHPETAEPLDLALVLWLPGPASATGEDTAEFHVHGGLAVIEGVLAALARLPGLRPAEPGAFTRRAFDNGKLDLTRVEGLGDLLAAETQAQRRQALQQLGGRLERLYEGWRDRLVRTMAYVAADLDFAEGEDDVPAGLPAAVRQDLADLSQEIEAHLNDSGRGERLRQGLTVAITGAPNAGKSSLVNWLAGRDVAIVSPYAGTTRDTIEVHLNLGGYPVTVIDTAGLRETHDPIEREGIARARARAAAADLVVHLSAPDAAEEAPPASGAPIWRYINKADLLAGTQGNAISVTQGQGMDDFVARLTGFAASQMPQGDAPMLTRARHRQHLEACRSELIAAQSRDDDPVLQAEHLRRAAQALGTLTGRIDIEDLLDVIFREFCIGK